MQQGDVKLFQTVDNGEINVTGGLVEMSGGLETSAYLSLFGGNEDDDGSKGDPLGWWGNLLETQPEREYHSETQHLLQDIPATSNNLKRIEDAAKRDLKWFVDTGVATEILVNVSIPSLNMLKLEIEINQERFTFVENWRAK